MAFHPFAFFRKRQKTFLAALTILSMFIFILTGFSGGCDQTVGGRWFKQQKDPTEVTKLYGKKVSVSDIDDVLQHRQMANIFIAQAVAASSTTADQKLSTVDAEAADHVRMTIGQLQQFLRMGIPLQNLARFGMLSKPIQDLRSYQLSLLKSNKVEAARIVGKIAASYSLMEWEILHPTELYFGGGTTPDDLLDFLVWKNQADKLDITLTDEDLRKAVNAEADSDVLSGDSAKDNEKIGTYLRGARFRTIEPKVVFDALRDEFRVRLAKEVLLGSAGSARSAAGAGMGGGEVPGLGTPDEFWDYYKEQLTSLKVAFLKIPVKQFTEGVKAQPTQQELDDLYRRYKNDEPNPERPTPGFKLPRKVKVQWVAADSESPHYREAVDKAMPALKASGPLALLPFPAVSGGTASGPAGAAAQMAVGSLWNVPQQFEYLAYLKGVKSWWDATSVVPEGTNPYATGLRRPDTVASVLGQAIGAGATGAPPVWSAAETLAGATEARVAEQKLRQASMVLAGSNPFPLSVAAQEAALSNVHVPRLSEVQDDLTTELRNRIAPRMADAALDEFVKGLDAKHFNPQEAAEYVKNNANIEHGITSHGVMADALDEYHIADAPALAPLRGAAEKGTPFTPNARRQFAEQFFTTIGMDGRPTQTQLYQPQRLSDIRTNATYYWWLTESEKPKVRNKDEAAADVKEAWNLIQARKEARQSADHIIDELKKRPEGIAADRFLKDEAERLKADHPNAGYETSDLLGISRLVRKDTPMLMMTAPTQYEPYHFPETTITYPRADTVDELLKQLKQPGDAMVFTDRPERDYYIAVLEERKVPSERDFYDVYMHAPRTASDERLVITNSLWSRFQEEREQKYRDAVVRHLREESQAPLDDQGNYRMDPELRKRIRGGSGEE
jgi:hypothetical protein